MSDETKPCNGCGAAVLPTRGQVKWHTYRCRACKAEDNRRQREKYAAAGKSTSGSWEARRVQQSEYRARPEVKRQEADRIRRRSQDPEEAKKIAARIQLRRAVVTGLVERENCKACGAERTHGHHHDYEQPLNVTWLCSPCHKAEHKRLRNGK